MDVKLSNEKTVSNTVEEEVSKSQNKFIQNVVGKALNVGFDKVLKAFLPNVIEDEVIEIKNAFFEDGFKSGIKEIGSTIKNIAKSTLGIITGNFDNTDQIRKAAGAGGVLDAISKTLNVAVDASKKKGLINASTARSLKSSKNNFIKAVKADVAETLDQQVGYTEKIDKYCQKWTEAFNKQDLKEMEKAYKNMEKYLKKTLTTQNIFKKTANIENIHNLIKNNRR